MLDHIRSADVGFGTVSCSEELAGVALCAAVLPASLFHVAFADNARSVNRYKLSLMPNIRPDTSFLSGLLGLRSPSCPVISLMGAAGPFLSESAGGML